MLSFSTCQLLSERASKRKLMKSDCTSNRFHHHRLKGSNRFRVRVGDYRIIYTYDVEQNRIHLLAIGHRREIYRGS
jgi:mRNA-degrading endonuclease RelE of RelBE toxin-antitoxin system